jgi:hypothetical protein
VRGWIIWISSCCNARLPRCGAHLCGSLRALETLSDSMTMVVMQADGIDAKPIPVEPCRPFGSRGDALAEGSFSWFLARRAAGASAVRGFNYEFNQPSVFAL